jgi:signal transduction histidine kinase
MATPDTIELLSFRRTFTLLILLVVLPSAGLSGFGVLAIVNERAAVEKRLEAVWTGRVAQASAELRGWLEDAQVETNGAFHVSSQGLTLSEVSFRVDGPLVTCDDARLTETLARLATELSAVPERLVIFSLSEPQGTVLLAARRQGAQVLGASLSLEAVGQLVTLAGAHATPAGDLARFALVPVQKEAASEPGGLVARFVSGVSEVRQAALGPRQLASQTLAAPLQDFRLVAFVVGEDPVAQASTRNRVWYAVLLGLFYVTLVLGVVFTGRTLYREAKLSRLKTDFVSLVSHELRTPLTSIRMFIEMLALGRVKDPAEMQQVLDMLSKETARLSTMIENVLDWARIEAGRKAYERTPTPPGVIAETAAQAFRAQRVGTALDFTVDVAEGLPTLDVDRDALAGALLNLLSNAFKYSPHDKRIALKVLAQDGEVIFEVEDHGIGIPRRELKRIFDRFYRVDSRLSRSTEGSGLGLSIAQRIVQAHGGRVSVDSVVNQGSTFRLHLPVTP